MPEAPPENEPEPSHSTRGKLPRRNIYAAETIGLVLIALALLALTLVRYGRNIHWSWR